MTSPTVPRTPTDTLTATDTAAMLRARLGALRAWGDFLSDNIRGKQHIRGLTLMPCAKLLVRGQFRPVYALRDIEQFIDAVLRVEPRAGRAPIKSRSLMIDTRKPWGLNRFDKAGNPVARLLRSCWG